MAIAPDPNPSLFRALREHLIGPDDGIEYYAKGFAVTSDVADLVARLHTAAGAKAPFGEFLGVLLHQILTKSEHSALAAIPAEAIKGSKEKIFRMVAKVDKKKK